MVASARRHRHRHAAGVSFNPLHCGAVVASSIAGTAKGNLLPKFQSPSLRGSGRFAQLTNLRQQRDSMFQSPSLRGSGRFPARRKAGGSKEEKFQSPSLRGSGRFMSAPTTVWTAQPSFNPLHCGAVVASWKRRCIRRRTMVVSIPFIAGQWSLPPAQTRHLFAPAAFQSPSLRGSGRFARRMNEQLIASLVSIPFIAGQWSLLLIIALIRFEGFEFQSPSLRGSGRFAPHALGSSRFAGFNPLHCGAVVASFRRQERARLCGGFNPLHCGAVVASRWRSLKSR